MAAKLEESTGIKRLVQVTIPQSEIDSEITKRTQEVAQTAKLPGFRPGKVPLKVIQQQFSASIRSEAVSKLIEKAYSEALTSLSLNPAGMPKITVDESSVGGDLSFKIELEVFPEFKVEGLSEIQLTRLSAHIQEKDMEKMFENLRKQHTSWKKVDRQSKEGDRLMIDFEGFKGNEAFQGGSAQDFRIVLGSNSMIPGFETALIGKKAGEDFDMNIQFPADYHVADLAGQPVVFKIKLKEVEAPELPELNDAFAQLFQVASLEALKQEVRSNMERELEFALKGSLKNQVIEGLLKHNPIDLPSALVDSEAERLAQVAAERMKSWGQASAMELPKDLFAEEAKKRVALGLIMNQIIVQYALKVDAERVKVMVDKMASVYDNAEEIKKLFYQNKDRMSEIQQLVMEEQVVDKVAEMAQVTDEIKDFDEVMKGVNATSNILPQA